MPRDYAQQRQQMVAEQIQARGIRDARILQTFLTVPRHCFVPPEQVAHAYEDTPLPIGDQQTISQPYIVAFMTQAAGIPPGGTVLEIGTGSGYQTAILSYLASEVYSVEIIPALAHQAQQTLQSLQYGNIHLFQGNGYHGLPTTAPYNAILVTAAPPEVPPALLEQLAPQGRLVIPVGDRAQVLMVFQKTSTGILRTSTLPVRFVPMTG